MRASLPHPGTTRIPGISLMPDRNDQGVAVALCIGKQQAAHEYANDESGLDPVMFHNILFAMVVSIGIDEQDSFQIADCNQRIAGLCLDRYRGIETGQL